MTIKKTISAPNGAATADGGKSPTRQPRGCGRRLHGAIAHKLGVAIVSGEYAPGEILSGEALFAQSLDVSRGAYRESIQGLIAKGLVESHPRTGTRVLPRDRWNLLDPDVLAWSFAGTPDPELIRNLFELRLIIEPAAAGIAAVNRDQSHIKRMNEALATMRRYSLMSEFGRLAERHFHEAILGATRNDALVALSASISAVVNWTTQYKLQTFVLPRDPVPDQVLVYNAIAAADVERAKAAMRRLVELALEDTRDMTRGIGEP